VCASMLLFELEQGPEGDAFGLRLHEIGHLANTYSRHACDRRCAAMALEQSRRPGAVRFQVASFDDALLRRMRDAADPMHGLDPILRSTRLVVHAIAMDGSGHRDGRTSFHVRASLEDDTGAR
jgi:hypothetical protein